MLIVVIDTPMMLIKEHDSNMVENSLDKLSKQQVVFFRIEHQCESDDERVKELLKNIDDMTVSKIISKKINNYKQMKDFLIKELEKEIKQKEKDEKDIQEKKNIEEKIECEINMRVKEKIEKYKKEAENKIRDLEEKESKVQKLLMNNYQLYGENVEDYVLNIISQAGDLPLQTIKSILYATVARKMKTIMNWDKIDSVETLKREAKVADMTYRVSRTKVARRTTYFNQDLNKKSSDYRYFSSENKINYKKQYENKIIPELDLNNKIITTRCDNKNDENQPYKGYECEIKTIEGKMVKSKPCKVNKSMTESLNREILKLLKNKIIQESNSDWSNPVRPVIKKNGQIRLCLNLMALNEISYKNEELMPDVEHILNKLQGSKWFSVIDMKEGFFQIKIKQEDMKKTAFQVEGKKYEFCRMPMGFKNAPFVFQRIMNHELREWIDKNAQVYLDDIVVYAKTEIEHDRVLKQILNKLEAKNLKINNDKIQLKKNEIHFLGYIVNGETLRIPTDKKDKLLEIKEPTTKKELQRFLGLINHHRRFISNYTQKTEKLYDLLKDKNSISNWNTTHRNNFNSLKEDIAQFTKRYLPNYKKPFILECDASNGAVSAILYQMNSKTKLKEMIYPTTKKLTKNEKNWGITEKELFAIVYGIRKFKDYLNGKHFKIISDHMALQWIKSKENFGNSKIQRWLEEIMGYDFDIEYRKGENMGLVDFLTRDLPPGEEDAMAMSDKQREMISVAHRNVGHRSVEATEYELSKICTVWPRQKLHLKEFIQNCEQCLRNKVKKGGGEVFIEAKDKLEKFGIDIAEIKEEYILVGIDFYSRMGYLEKIKNKKATTIIKPLEKWFHDKKYPKILIHDSGREFENEMFKKWTTSLGIENHTTAVESPKSNGRAERFIRTLRDYIRKDSTLHITSQVLKKLTDKYNNTLHSALGKTPYEVWNENKEEKEGVVITTTFQLI